MERLFDIIESIWHYQVLTINKNPLMVEQIVVAGLTVIGGLALSRFARTRVHHVLERKSKLTQNGVAALEKLVYYFLVLTAFYLALRIVHIPLTTFAFLGGAAAVALGFGAKNVFNNFISGFILMTERPIRVGDVIEVENEIGVVQDIGMRSARVHTEDNIHIIFPNSKLLDEKIINWTLSDNEILTSVTVGIGYKDDPEEASRLMVKAVSGCPKTLPTPKSFALFWDFGDNALVFHVYFPARVSNKMERWSAESDARFAIFKELTQAGITIAYPQRDTHLDTTTPLEIRVLQNN